MALFLARLCVCRVLVVGTGSTERGASLALTPCGGDTIWRFALSVADQVLLLQRDLQMYKELQSETTANILDARLQLSQFSEQAEVLEGQVAALTNMAAALAQVVSRLNSSDTGSSDAGSAVIAGGSGGTTMSAVSAASAALAAVSEGVSRVSNGADTNGTLLAEQIRRTTETLMVLSSGVEGRFVGSGGSTSGTSSATGSVLKSIEGITAAVSASGTSSRPATATAKGGSVLANGAAGSSDGGVATRLRPISDGLDSFIDAKISSILTASPVAGASAASQAVRPSGGSGSAGSDAAGEHTQQRSSTPGGVTATTSIKPLAPPTSGAAHSTVSSSSSSTSSSSSSVPPSSSSAVTVEARGGAHVASGSNFDGDAASRRRAMVAAGARAPPPTTIAIDGATDATPADAPWKAGHSGDHSDAIIPPELSFALGSASTAPGSAVAAAAEDGTAMSGPVWGPPLPLALEVGTHLWSSVARAAAPRLSLAVATAWTRKVTRTAPTESTQRPSASRSPPVEVSCAPVCGAASRRAVRAAVSCTIVCVLMLKYRCPIDVRGPVRPAVWWE